MKKIIYIFCTLYILAMIAGCATIGSDQFLVTNLDNSEKSDILTNKGIVYYEQQLKNSENYLLVPKSKAFFENALVYNPENAIARKYLDRLNGFIEQQVSKNLELAGKYKSKEGKSEQDIFNLCYFTQKAYEVDPENKDVRELKSEIHDMQEELISTYIERGNENLKGLEAAAGDKERQDMYLKAHNNFGRALLLDPEHGQAAKAQNTVKDGLEAIAVKSIGKTKNDIAADRFDSFEDDIKGMRFLDAKIDNRLKGQIDDLYYRYHFQRAANAFSKKDYRRAEAYINSALAVERTQEALDYRSTIRERRSAADMNREFGELIAEVDSTIEEGNLLEADTALRRLRERTTSASQKNQIDAKLKSIRDRIPALYKKGVELYQKEDYKAAVETLETVVALDASYEQAGPYLEKAKGRLRILESF